MSIASFVGMGVDSAVEMQIDSLVWIGIAAFVGMKIDRMRIGLLVLTIGCQTLLLGLKMSSVVMVEVVVAVVGWLVYWVFVVGLGLRPELLLRLLLELGSERGWIWVFHAIVSFDGM